MADRWTLGAGGGFGILLRGLSAMGLAATLAAPAVAQGTPAVGQGAQAAAPPLAERVTALAPALDAYVTQGMAAFDVPGAAIGIVGPDGLVYAKGFGVRAKDDPRPVDTATIFQVGSTTKSFLATTLAKAVDDRRITWDEAVIDLDPDFALKDPWVTREFRVFDLIAQRSGLRPYVNDTLAVLGYSGDALVASLRYAEPVSSFRSTFAYTNITHLLAGRILARLYGERSWDDLARRTLIEPLAMSSTSFTRDAIATAPNHAEGHRFTAGGSVQVPFDENFPYRLGPAGNINSNLEDMARWVRFQMADGELDGKRLVSTQNLAITRWPRVAINDTLSYAMGWVITSSADGRVVWHNGGTAGFGAHIGFMPGKGFGVVVLSNEGNRGFPDAVAQWIYLRLIGADTGDPVAAALAQAKAAEATADARFKPPADARPAGDLAGLAGTFANPAMGMATVTADGTRLTMTLQQTGAQLALSPFDGVVFSVKALPVGPLAGLDALTDETVGFAQFEANADGHLSTLVLDQDGQRFPFAKH